MSTLHILQTLFVGQELQQFKNDFKCIVTPTVLDAVHLRTNDNNIEICGEIPTHVMQCYKFGLINNFAKGNSH